MAEKEWLIKLKDGEYRISLKHGTLLRKYYVKLDGDIINPQRTIIEKGDKLTFNIYSHSCVLLIYFIKGGVKYECIIDGTSVETKRKLRFRQSGVHQSKGVLSRFSCKYGI